VAIAKDWKRALAKLLGGLREHSSAMREYIPHGAKPLGIALRIWDACYGIATDTVLEPPATFSAL
jgi:hypothetical protein